MKKYFRMSDGSYDFTPGVAVLCGQRGHVCRYDDRSHQWPFGPGTLA